MGEEEKPTVVVVDDEPAIVDVVCDVLEDVDVAAVGCSLGHRAYTTIRREQPELVLLDVQMPGVDGISVFQCLRNDPATSDIPVIFFTANTHILQERLPDYHRQGAQLLAKPFNVSTLLDTVERALAS